MTTPQQASTEPIAPEHPCYGHRHVDRERVTGCAICTAQVAPMPDIQDVYRDAIEHREAKASDLFAASERSERAGHRVIAESERREAEWYKAEADRLRIVLTTAGFYGIEPDEVRDHLNG